MVIEIYCDKIQVSQKFIRCQISGYKALPFALGARNDMASVFAHCDSPSLYRFLAKLPTISFLSNIADTFWIHAPYRI